MDPPHPHFTYTDFNFVDIFVKRFSFQVLFCLTFYMLLVELHPRLPFVHGGGSSGGSKWQRLRETGQELKSFLSHTFLFTWNLMILTDLAQFYS